jgi:hypothetical protein
MLQSEKALGEAIDQEVNRKKPPTNNQGRRGSNKCEDEKHSIFSVLEG